MGYPVKMVFYQNKADEKVIDKTSNLYEKFTIDNVMWKENTSITKPIFTFHKDGKWKQFNYVAMIWRGWRTRYFFVRDFRMQPGGIIEITCDEDYRYTWKDEILAMRVLVARQENINNKAFYDERKIKPLGKLISSKAIGDVGDDTSTFVLTVSTG